MKRFVVAVFSMMLALTHLAAADSQSSAVADAAKKSLTTPTPQTFISNKILDFFRPKTGEGLIVGEETVKTVQRPARKPRPVVDPNYVPPAPAATPAPQTAQIRQEIQTILELNKKIKNIQGDRVQQLQRIQEQARIHQKILDQIEADKGVQEQEPTTDKDALLAQEKLRIIHEETKRNQALMTESVEGVAPLAPTGGDELRFVPVLQDKTTSKN